MNRPFDAQETALRILGDTGDVQLASLTREELRGVGDDPLLANAADSLWWEALGAREQELVLETAQRGLLARNLLEPDDAGSLRATEEVRLVLAARTAPDWMMVLGEPGAPRDSDGAPSQIALLALPSRTGRTSEAVLVTARLEGIYLHRLVTAGVACDVAADWLLRPTEDAEATSSGRTVELLREAGSGPTHARALVVRDGDAAYLSEVREGEPTEPAPTSLADLSAWLRGRLPAPEGSS